MLEVLSCRMWLHRNWSVPFHVQCRHSPVPVNSSHVLFWMFTTSSAKCPSTILQFLGSAICCSGTRCKEAINSVQTYLELLLGGPTIGQRKLYIQHGMEAHMEDRDITHSQQQNFPLLALIFYMCLRSSQHYHFVTCSPNSPNCFYDE